MVTTANKNYTQQVTGSNVNTWGVVNNSNFAIIDTNLGGRLAVNVGGGVDVTASASDCQNLIHELSGVLTADINYILPLLGGFYILNNATSGNHTLAVIMDTGSVGVIIPQGMSAFVTANPDDQTVKVTLTTANVFQGIGATGGSANAQTLAVVTPGPYVFGVDGPMTTFDAGFSNSAAMTLNIAGTGAIGVQYNTTAGLADVPANAIRAGGRYITVYDETANKHILINPSLGTAALQPIGTFLQAANNLSDVVTPATARTNIGAAAAATTLSVTGLITGGGSLAANRSFDVNRAVQADMEAGTTLDNAVVPGVLRYFPGVAKAWVCFGYSAGTPTMVANYNWTSFTDNGTGNVTINWAITMSSVNYGIHATGGLDSGGSNYCFAAVVGRTATTSQIQFVDAGNIARDVQYAFVSIFGDL